MMNTVVFISVIFFTFFGRVFGFITNNVIVDGLGTVNGSVTYTSWTNRTVYSFRSIPYAEPPTGDLRFRPPVPKTTWNGTLDATKIGNTCPQSLESLIDNPNNFIEDCLTLNVYVPEVDSSETKLPVIIYIHGGTFKQGNGSSYQPDFLLEEDVILVVPQFRLGLLGLLCLHTDEVPGNVQFLDQIMAMQWVQDNIGYFGGDKDQVTLFGQSSGASSVNLHLLSPLSKGLFHRAIMNSGSALGSWVMDYNPIATATVIAKMLGCNTTTIPSITKCMKNATVEDLITTYVEYYALYTVTGGAAIVGGNRAVVQQAGEYKFLTEEPEIIVKNGNFTQLPLMGGATKHDGSWVLTQYFENPLEINALWNNSNYLENNLTSYLINVTGIPDTTGGIRDTMINTYFQNGELGDFYAMLPGLIDICSVLRFKASIYKMLYFNSFYQNTYLYAFNYLGSFSSFNASATYPFDGGISHSQDLTYLFPYDYNFTEDDLAISKRVVQLWTSFAKNSVPTADGVESWPAMSTRSGPYLSIDTTATIRDDYLYEYTAAIREAAEPSLAHSIVSKPALIIILSFIPMAGHFSTI